MILQNNIRFLRKKHRFSQIELAKRLDLNRGNITSYEKGTNPPIDILVKMGELFNVSLDLLINTDLETLLKNEGLHPLPESILTTDLTTRLEQFIALVGKDIKSLCELTGIDEKVLLKLLKSGQSADLEIFCKIFSTYSWLNANWLMKGGAEHPVRMDDTAVSTQIAQAAESNSKDYGSEMLKTMAELKKRIEQLEKDAKKKAAKK